MRLQTWWWGGLILAVLTGAALGSDSILVFNAPGGPRALEDIPPVDSPMVLAEASRDQARFVSQADWCWTGTTVLEDGNAYTTLDLPGMAAGGELGEPRIPYHGRFVRVPDGAEVRLVIDAADWEDMPGRYTVDPCQPPLFDSRDAPRPAFTRSATAYTQDRWFPETPVYIADRMRVRGREFVYVVYAPVAYNPARAALRAAPRVEWRLEYDIPDEGVPTPRPDPVGEGAFADFFETTIDATVPDVFSTLALGDPEPLSTGADYLILFPVEFVTPVARLAQLKGQMGLSVRMISLESIGNNLTALDLRAYIKNAYDTWSPRPTYLLLVGDAHIIPPHDERVYPTRPGMPATDLYYATVDGTDIFPDLHYGRLTAGTRDECNTIINKIVNHQLTPDPDPAYRRNILISAYFQDISYGDDGKPVAPADGIEDRWFVETAESLANHARPRGRTVYTTYLENSTYPSRRYNISSILHPNKSNYIGAQAYWETEEARLRIRNTFRTGVSYALYRAHGSVVSWDALSVWEIPLMQNETRLPFVMSVTCQTGWFDFESEELPWLRSLCEGFLAEPNGGAVAIVGATRNSNSGWNDWFVHGVHESLWPGFLGDLSAISGYRSNLAYGNNPVGRSQRLGHAVNFGKRVMYDKEAGGKQSRARYQYEVLMLFGDPHMHFEPWRDNRLLTTLPASADAAYATFNVDVTDQNGVPAAGATVTVTSEEGDNLVRTTSAAGRAAFAFAPLALNTLDVHVTKPGWLPITGFIPLLTGPMNVTHPASISAVAAAFTVTARRPDNTPIADARVQLLSDEGDDREAFTDASGQSHFAIVPLTHDRLRIRVTKRSYTTYMGTIQVIPGTMTATHAPQTDERAPFEVTVRRGDGVTLRSASVKLIGAGGVVDEEITDINGLARFATMPAGPMTLTVNVTCLTYAPVESAVDVVPGYFRWAPLPGTLILNRPQTAEVALVSALNHQSVLAGYAGTAALSALGQPVPPPPVLITDCRRYTHNSLLILQNVQRPGSVALDGWMLAMHERGSPINAVHSDIKDLSGPLDAGEQAFHRGQSGSSDYWAPLGTMLSSASSWIMLLDERTNIVDFVAWGLESEELATLAPNIRGRVVPVGSQWMGDGVPLGTGGENGMMTARRRVDQPRDRNVAADFEVLNSALMRPPFETPFEPYGEPIRVTPGTIGPFVGGIWTGTITMQDLGTDIRLRAVDGPRTGNSGAFDVALPSLSHFAFATIPSPQVWGAPFTITVEAMDDNVRYTDFNAPVSLYAFVEAVAAGVLISECGLKADPHNFVEIQHVSDLPVDTSGWKLLAGDDPDDINRFNPVVCPLPATMSQHQTLAWRDGDDTGAGRWGARLGWTEGAPGWVMLLDDANRIVDFVAWDWEAEAIATMAPVYMGVPLSVGGQWIGPGAAVGGEHFHGITGSLQRHGDADNNRAQDFQWGLLSSRGGQNAALQVPITQARRPVRMEPARSGSFASGLWSGQVAIHENVQNVFVEAMADNGIWGDSNPFNIQYYGALTLSVPSPITEGSGTVQAMVSTPRGAGANIQLVSSDPSRLQVPPSVTVGLFALSNTFSITVMDNDLLDFTHRVDIIASSVGHSPARARVTVLDDESTAIDVQLPASVTEGDGLLPDAGLIQLGGNVTSNTVFTMGCGDWAKITIPHTVTVPEGRSRAYFDLTILENAIPDGPIPVDISATPDGLMSGAGTILVQDNDAFAFAFAPLPTVVTAGVPFAVTVEARDLWGDPVATYRGPASLEAFNKDGDVPLSADATGAFSNGVWSGAVAVQRLGRATWLEARDGEALGQSDPFDVTHGPLARFGWTLPDMGDVHAGAWLPVTLHALDAGGFPVGNYSGPAQVRATRHDPDHPVRVLSFGAYAQPRAEADVHAAIQRHFPHAVYTSTVETNAVALGALLAGHHVFLLPAQADAPSDRLQALGVAWRKTLQSFVEDGGVVIACSGLNDEHLLLSGAEMLDLMIESIGAKESPFVGLSVSVTNRLTAGLAPEFEGEDVVGFSGADAEGVVRSQVNNVPAAMHRAMGAGHVVMLGSDFAPRVAAFDRLLANAVRLALRRVPQPVPAAPAVAVGFTNGAWESVVQLGFDGIDACLIADDSAGPDGASEMFDLGPLRILDFRLSATGLEIDWSSAGVTPYIIEHREDRPDGIYTPLESDIMATPPTNTHKLFIDGGTRRFIRLRPDDL